MRPSAAITRLVSLAVTFFGVAIVVFIIVRVAPGDPIAMMIGPGASAQDIADLRALYGLDKSIPAQFLIWLGHVARGDFGVSISLRYLHATRIRKSRISRKSCAAQTAWTTTNKI